MIMPLQLLKLGTLLVGVILTSIGAQTLFTAPSTKTVFQNIVSRLALVALVLMHTAVLTITIVCFTQPSHGTDEQDPSWMGSIYLAANIVTFLSSELVMLQALLLVYLIFQHRGTVVIGMTTMAVLISIVLMADTIEPFVLPSMVSHRNHADTIEGILDIASNILSVFSLTCCILFIKQFAQHLEIKCIDLTKEIMKKHNGYRFVVIALIRSVMIVLSICKTYHPGDGTATQIYLYMFPFILSLEFATYVELSFKTIRLVYDSRTLPMREDYPVTSQVSPVEIQRSRTYPPANANVVDAGRFSPNPSKQLDLKNPSASIAYNNADSFTPPSIRRHSSLQHQNNHQPLSLHEPTSPDASGL